MPARPLILHVAESGLQPGICVTHTCGFTLCMDCSRVLEELLLLGKGPQIRDPPFLLLHPGPGAL